MYYVTVKKGVPVLHKHMFLLKWNPEKLHTLLYGLLFDSLDWVLEMKRENKYRAGVEFSMQTLVTDFSEKEIERELER